jgi:retron-type reverse transcriptase
MDAGGRAMQEQLPSSEEVPVMGMERRAEESGSLIQTRLTGSEQYFETSGRSCEAANDPLGGKQEARSKVDSLWTKNRGMQAKVSGKRRKEMIEERLMDAILHPINLQNAQDAVRRNKGCAGIDGKSIAETEQHWQQHGPEIEAKLRTGSYIPTPLRGMKIAKANGGGRLLGIPTVQDRIIQQAVQQILADKFDRGFSQHSYGYRAGHSAQQAVLMARSYVRAGKSWVVDIDISAFFDEVNHDILLHQISRKIEDKQVFRVNALKIIYKQPIKFYSSEIL